MESFGQLSEYSILTTLLKYLDAYSTDSLKKTCSEFHHIKNYHSWLVQHDFIKNHYNTTNDKNFKLHQDNKTFVFVCKKSCLKITINLCDDDRYYIHFSPLGEEPKFVHQVKLISFDHSFAAIKHPVEWINLSTFEENILMGVQENNSSFTIVYINFTRLDQIYETVKVLKKDQFNLLICSNYGGKNKFMLFYDPIFKININNISALPRELIKFRYLEDKSFLLVFNSKTGSNYLYSLHKSGFFRRLKPIGKDNWGCVKAKVKFLNDHHILSYHKFKYTPQKRVNGIYNTISNCHEILPFFTVNFLKVVSSCHILYQNIQTEFILFDFSTNKSKTLSGLSPTIKIVSGKIENNVLLLILKIDQKFVIDKVNLE